MIEDKTDCDLADVAIEEARECIAAARRESATKLKLPKGLKSIPKEIGELTQLQELAIDDTGIMELSPLTSLDSLQKLYISRTPVEDLTPLADLGALRRLTINNIGATDFSPLVRISELRYLKLHGSEPFDDAFYKSTYDFKSEPLVDMSWLAPLPKLEILLLDENHKLKDIVAFGHLTSLRFLDLSSTAVSDISSLSSLARLEWLNLRETQVFDISSLASLKRLEELRLSNTKVKELTPLAKLKNLKHLSVARTLVEDIGPLSGLRSLETLHLDNTQVSNLDAVAEFTSMVDQWSRNKKEDDPYDTEKDDEKYYVDWDNDFEHYDNQGISYYDTPASEADPFAYLVRMTVARRTIETINFVRKTKSLPAYYPEGYESIDPIIKPTVAEKIEHLADMIRHDRSWLQTLKQWIAGGVLTVVCSVTVFLVVTAYEADLRDWIEQIGGSPTLTRILDWIVRTVS